MTHPKIDNHRVGEHPFVTQLLKGIFNSRPPQSRYSGTWVVGKVVSCMDSLGPNNLLSLKVLSQKLGVLLGLTSLERVSEIVAHDLRFRRFLPEGVVFDLPDLTKKSRFQNSLKTSFHASFPSNPKLCVVNCLHEYGKRTKNFRPLPDESKPNKLLLSYIRPHKPISSETLSRWVVAFLSESGVDTDIFKAHSVRGAASSAAMNVGVSLKDILNLADWSQNSTFVRFYYRPAFNPNVAHGILASVGQGS